MEPREEMAVDVRVMEPREERAVDVRVMDREKRSAVSLQAIQGIGPATAAKLAAAGIGNVRDLLEGDESVIAAAAGVNLARVRAWRAQGIGDRG